MSEGKKTCPLNGSYCDEGCGMWDDSVGKCGFVSTAQRLSYLNEMKLDLYWLRKELEGGR